MSKTTCYVAIGVLLVFLLIVCLDKVFSNQSPIQQDTISRFNFTIVCKKNTNECFCIYPRTPGSTSVTLGSCPFEEYVYERRN